MPFYIIKSVYLRCDCCGKYVYLNTSNPRDARKEGWSISKDYKKCYCPDCADKMRSKGMKGKH